MRTRLVLVMALVMIGLLITLVARRDERGAEATLQLGGPAQRIAYDRADRDFVIDAFYDVWLANTKIPLGWTGSVSGCRPGTISTDAREAARRQVNYYRAMLGLRTIGLDADLNGTAQRTALMMDANNALSHYPPDSWRCRTAAGDRVASRSNLALGSSVRGASAVGVYMTDPGTRNTHVGHRRWLINPRTAKMAIGSTSTANAIVVAGMPQHDEYVPRWLPWPAPGYFPSPLEPDGRWSLSTPNKQTDFSRAVVSVTDDAGRSYDVRRYSPVNGMGPRTLVWHVSGLQDPDVGQDRTYRIRVARIYRDGDPIPPVTYSVTMVRPDRQLRVVEEPVVRGTFAVGEELTVSRGTWSPAATSATYQWTRDGVAIPGATYPFYRLTATDARRRVGVVVRGRAHYYVPGYVAVSGSVVR